MKPNEGRLQTGEHILAKIIEDKVKDAKIVIARFDKENEGSLDVSTQTDLRGLDLKEVEKEVNDIIKRGLSVNKIIKKREEIEDKFDLSKIPSSVKEIRIVEIDGWDKRACKDPHVENTKEIGYFEVLKLERVGKDRYRFVFSIM